MGLTTKITLLFCLFLFPLSGLLAQEKADTPSDDVRLFYRTEMYGGIMAHSQGFGLNFRKGFRKTGFKKNLLSIELVNMRHPKEYKSFNPYVDDTKGFFFGKLNSLFILRPSFGRQKVLYSKEARKGVSVSMLYFGGVSIGLLKPIYLEVANRSLPSYDFLTTERYDSESHSFDRIFGRAPFTRGLDELQFYPGLHTKFALNFEYAPMDDLLRAIETGASLDVFHKEVPLMAFADNSQFFLTLYINLQFGKKFI